MKTFFTIICTFLICHATSIGKGIDFFHGSFEEAKELAAKEGRLIFIDAFTTWCGPCKRMSATVFSHQDAGEYYNNTFINLKLDMEKGEGKAFQQKYRVNAFPTLLFLDPAGMIVHRVVGGMDVPGFVSLGKLAASKSNVSSTYDQEYEDGNREPAFMAKYIEAMAKGKRPVLKVANEYLSGQSDYSTPENLTVIYYATVEADSRVFDLFVENRKALTKMYGNDAMEEKVVLAADATVTKAIEFGTVELLEDALGKVKKYAPEKYKEYQYTAPLNFYAKTQNSEEYVKIAKDYARRGPEQKFELANTILHNMRDQPKLLRQAEIWAVEAAREKESEETCFIAAQLLFITEQYEGARDFAKIAEKYALDTKSGTLPHIKKLLKSIDSKMRMP